MEAILQVAIQVPALALVSFVFLRAFQMVLDTLGRKIDRLADAIEQLARRKS